MVSHYCSTTPFYSSTLRIDDQRTDHPRAGGFVGVRMAVEGIGAGLRGLEERYVALASWNERMDIELIDVKVMGRGVGVVEPQHLRLADLRGDVRLVEHVVLGRQRWERG